MAEGGMVKLSIRRCLRVVTTMKELTIGILVLQPADVSVIGKYRDAAYGSSASIGGQLVLHVNIRPMEFSSFSRQSQPPVCT